MSADAHSETASGPQHQPQQQQQQGSFKSNALVYRSSATGVSTADPVEERFAYNPATAVWTKRKTREVWRPVVVMRIRGGMAQAVGARAADMALLVVSLEPHRTSTHAKALHVQLPVPFCAPVYSEACALVALVVGHRDAPVSCCDERLSSGDGSGRKSHKACVPLCAVGVSLKKMRTLCRNWPHADAMHMLRCYTHDRFSAPFGRTGILTEELAKLIASTQHKLSSTDHGTARASKFGDGDEEAGEDDDCDEDDNDSEDPAIVGHVATGIDTDAPIGSITRDGTRKGSGPIKSLSAREAVAKAAMEAKYMNAEIELLYADVCNVTSTRRPDHVKDYVQLLSAHADQDHADANSDAQTVASSAMTVYGPNIELGSDGLPVQAHDLSDVEVECDSEDEAIFGDGRPPRRRHGKRDAAARRHRTSQVPSTSRTRKAGRQARNRLGDVDDAGMDDDDDDCDGDDDGDDDEGDDNNDGDRDGVDDDDNDLDEESTSVGSSINDGDGSETTFDTDNDLDSDDGEETDATHQDEGDATDELEDNDEGEEADADEEDDEKTVIEDDMEEEFEHLNDAVVKKKRRKAEPAAKPSARRASVR